MPTIPIRGVGGVGVISDINPQDAPEISWTNAINMRFSKGEMSRYSICKYTKQGYTYSKTPTGISSIWPDNSGGYVTVFSDGTMEELKNNVTRSVTPTATLGLSQTQVTWSFLGGVKYLARESDIPVYLDSATSIYKVIPDWVYGQRCKSLRAYKDFLIALNVTKATKEYSGMVKWSDATQNGAPPTNWNTASDSSLAGETIINDIRGSIVDGLALGDSFMIYGTEQVYRMDYIGSPFIFNIAKAFDSFGAIAKNCVLEVDNKHYVFTKDDIIVHDGMQKQSIIDQKVSDKLFPEIDYDKMDRCFAYHDKAENELVFCYPASVNSRWLASDTYGCNKAAVYNYVTGTWSFIDLPAAVGVTEASMEIEKVWTSFADWDDNSASWTSFSSSRPRNIVITSAGNPTLSVLGSAYFIDRLYKGILPNPPVTSLLWPAYAESTNRDLDELAPNLLGRKQVSRITPQYRLSDLAHSISITVGTSATPTGSPVWGNRKEFCGYTSPKYDMRSNARYLSFRVDIPSGSYAELSGFDLDVTQISGR